ncbi:MAG: hypothetical protein U5K43_00325 [Halofilum sp. (in: g-proteobacteria)]|nr:hypothetical protein [Halofilum sp. (in: g-proteobacteria)]
MRDLPLPEGARLIAVVRQEQPLTAPDDVALAADDYVYVVADPAWIPDLEGLFGLARRRRWPAAERFFGAFTLRGRCPRAARSAPLYGIDPAAHRMSDSTIDEYVRERRFGHRRRGGRSACPSVDHELVRAVSEATAACVEAAA